MNELSEFVQMKISNRFEKFFNCSEVLKIFICPHEHFILGAWALVNLNWPSKFLQRLISFSVENSLQVKMCSHEISHWFENFNSVNLTEVKYCPKWTQTQSEIKFMWKKIKNTPRTKVDLDQFDFTWHLMWTYSNVKVWCGLSC